jgi:hypothetical protein
MRQVEEIGGVTAKVKKAIRVSIPEVHEEIQNGFRRHSREENQESPS